MQCPNGLNKMKFAKATPRPTEADPAQNYIHWILSGVLGAVFLTDICWSHHGLSLEASLLALAVIVIVSALGRQMPLQNVLLAVGITAFVGTLAHGLSALHGVGIPFGPIYFHEAFGAKLLEIVPWPIPLLWIVALFASRGTARVILRPWRKLKSYGYWLIGLTAVLIVVFDLALEPYAVSARDLWSWQLTKLPVTWYGVSLLNFISWAFVALLILAFATPTLIKKKPGSRTPLDLTPLLIWLGAIMLFGLGCAQAALWPAVALDAAAALIILGLAIPGARW